jgi:hypothetical protein
MMVTMRVRSNIFCLRSRQRATTDCSSSNMLSTFHTRISLSLSGGKGKSIQQKIHRNVHTKTGFTRNTVQASMLYI